VAKRRPTRRAFIRDLTLFGGGVALLGSCRRGKQEPSAEDVPLSTSHRVFTNAEFAILSAACDRVLPRDQDPGALDANVPESIDRALLTPELAQMREEFIPGLAALDRRAKRDHGKGFAALADAEKDALLSAFKDSAATTGEGHFYELLLTLTMEGFLGDPSYGGNKDLAGWALVGFDISRPPDGYDGVSHLHELTRFPGAKRDGGCH